MGRMEDLPDEMINHVRSFLAIQDSARSSLLCKSWLHAWSTIPTLLFHLPYLAQASEERKENFVNSVDDTLTRYHEQNLLIPMFELHLFEIDETVSSSINGWVRAAVGSGLKELCLYFGPHRVQYSLPLKEIFGSKTLESLKIRGSGFYDPRYSLSFCFDAMIKCYSLLNLELCNLHIDDTVDWENPSACGNLKHLKLNTVDIDDSLFHMALSKLSMLEQLELRSCKSLESLNIASHDLLRDLTVKKCNRLGEIKISELTSLERLELSSNKYLRQINIRCDSLKNLTLRQCDRVYQPELCAPKLEVLCYHGSTFPMLTSLCHIVPTHQLKTKVTLRNELFDTFSLSRLGDVIACSQQVHIYACSYKESKIDLDSFCLLVLRLRLSRELEILSISIRSQEPTKNYSTFLDALLAICRPRYLNFLCNGRGTMALLHFLIGWRTRTCCTSMGRWRKCWRHFLKSVEFGCLAGSEILDPWQLPVSWSTLEDQGSASLHKTPYNSFRLTWDHKLLS